jgi:hypothetical protein
MLQQQTGIAMNQEHLLDAVQQAAQARQSRRRLAGADDSQRHCTLRQEKLCSSVWLSDWSIPSSSDVMALRMALPKMGNSASASMRGLDCTESWSASSSSGCRARRSLISDACPVGTEPDRFGQHAGDIFGAARWIVQALAHGFPSRAIRAKQDGAQLGQRLIVRLGAWLHRRWACVRSRMGG